MDYIDNLKEIKEQLFDAPVEVKKAFNQVVEYFDNSIVHVMGDPYQWEYDSKLISDLNKIISQNKDKSMYLIDGSNAPEPGKPSMKLIIPSDKSNLNITSIPGNLTNRAAGIYPTKDFNLTAVVEGPPYHVKFIDAGKRYISSNFKEIGVAKTYEEAKAIAAEYKKSHKGEWTVEATPNKKPIGLVKVNKI